jgi:transposase InsO family protein
MIGIGRAKYYDWAKRLGSENNSNRQLPKQHWLTPEEKQSIIEFAKRYITINQYYLSDGYRRITYNGIDANVFACSPASVYRVLSKAGLLSKWRNKKSSKKGNGFNQPLEPHQHWHTDIKHINYKGTFLFFISIIDGFSRYIVHHELRTSMTEYDVEMVVQRAIEKYPDKKPRIISDNGSQYISKDFKIYMKEVGLQHIRTSTAYPQSNGKIERFHRSLEQECLRPGSLINLEDARQQVDKYVDYYNNNRLHSALFYLRPVDFLKGNVDELLNIRQEKLDLATVNRSIYWRESNIAS